MVHEMKTIRNDNSTLMRSLFAGFCILFVTFMITGCEDDGMALQQTILESQNEPGFLYDVAGIPGSYGKTGDGGPAREARLYWPQDVYILPTSGEIYIADWNNHSFRRIDLNGTISRAIGSGSFGDDSEGPADRIRLNLPTGMAVGPDGNIHIADWKNSKIKRIDHVSNYAITTVETEDCFCCQFPITVSLINSIVFDREGNMYFTDQGNGRVRKVDLQGEMSTFAGRFVKGYRNGIGQLAMFSWSRGPNALPGGKIAITATGDAIYLADQENNRIRRIDIATKEVTTVAGTGAAGYSGDGGAALSAELNYPCDVACAPNGDVYIADTRNHVVRRIDMSGIITTVAGTGVAGFSTNATPAADAMLNTPFGVHFDAMTNTVYIADTYNSQVKKLPIAE